MKKLLSIRLSYIYPTLFVAFLILLTYIRPIHLSAGQLALFSVNTFLFGFYFSPILNSQKTRVDSLIKTVRKETMNILDILAQSHLLPTAVRHELKVKLKAYVNSIMNNPAIQADNPYYDELLRFTKQAKYKDDAVMDSIYKQISQTQDDRDELNSLFQSKLFSHEWLVLAVLFSVTLFFVLQTDYGQVFFFRLLLAILCTGFSLLMIILIKYATLTHKQAKRIWLPLQQMDAKHFDDITEAEVEKAVKQIEGTAIS
jgi:hypothetical protein